MGQFLCTYFSRGRCNSVLYKILLIVISQLLLHGIAQNFRQNIRTTRDDIDIISVILPHQGALQLCFFENSSDSHNLASIAWNNTKFNVRHTYYMLLRPRSFCTNNSLGGASLKILLIVITWLLLHGITRNLISIYLLYGITFKQFMRSRVTKKPQEQTHKSFARLRSLRSINK